MGWSTPACSILAISRGSAVSDDDVDRISRNSRARYRNSEKMLTPVTTLSSGPEHDEDEERAGDVEGEHDHREALERVDAGLADDRGDGAERADRRRPT